MRFSKIMQTVAAGMLALTLIGGTVYAGSQTMAASLLAPATALAAEPLLEAGNPAEMAKNLVAASLIKATVEVTGLSRDQVLDELKAGKSLTQIAQAQGKTADDLIKQARGNVKQRLDQAVANGNLTQKQADRLLAQFDQRAATAVADTTLGARVNKAASQATRLALIRATANVTGLTPAEVRQQLEAGKSPAEIAQSKGKTGDDVVAEVRRQGQSLLDRLMKRAQQQVQQAGGK